MHGDTHVRFGGRTRETDPGQPGHRARVRPNWLIWVHAAANTAVRIEVPGGHRPALTVLITGIVDPAWLLEIEAVAAP